MLFSNSPSLKIFLEHYSLGKSLFYSLSLTLKCLRDVSKIFILDHPVQCIGNPLDSRCWISEAIWISSLDSSVLFRW